MTAECLKDIPGELHERPWVDFAFNRNEALDLARYHGRYLLFIDADEEFEYANNFIMPPLTQDYYLVKHQLKGQADFYRISLIRSDPKWSWKGIVHEGIEHPNLPNLKQAVLHGVVNHYHTTGGSRASDSEKAIKDAAILEKAIQNDPMNARYVFYLAHSYFAACQYAKALEIFEKRAAMPGCEQERFWSLFRIGIIQEFHLHLPVTVYLASFLNAYLSRPTRIEPLYYIAYILLDCQKHLMHYWLLKLVLALPYPVDSLTVERWMYDWGIDYQLLQSAYALGYQQEAYDRLKKVISCPDLPSDIRASLEKCYIWK